MLDLVTSVSTWRAAGFEFFTIDEMNYLAVENFWDGLDPKMGAMSVFRSK